MCTLVWGRYQNWILKNLGIWMGIYIYILVRDELGNDLGPRSYSITFKFINPPSLPHLAHINF